MYVQLGMFVMKYWKQLLLAIFFLIGLLFATIVGYFTQQSPPDLGLEGGGQALSPQVLQYKPLVEKYANKYEVSQHVPLLLAKIQQESGGRLLDVMQSSESIGLPPNSITDPEQSIDVGIRYFASVLKKAKNDTKLALQSYNFGSGFIPYAQARGGYSKEVAIEFSNMMAAKMGWARYGDVNYVDNVLRYLSMPASVGPILDNGNVASYYLNNFRISTRFTPFGNVYDTIHAGGVHNGIDLARKGSKSVLGMPVKSLSNGVVEQVLINHPQAGNGVRIKDGFLQYSYIHMQNPPTVKVGDKIQMSQAIGKVGNSGFSTGPHLDLKIKLRGEYIDPEKILRQMVVSK
ncbi:lysozyme family protein [Peribacillus frigoritolerans]|uniref:lysozyme family protein n=1 Tax=Peribacillus frigoritolerans TaxID=450367 RepID=UPI0021CF52E7|nr:lysozyme family protein [Peribacillus frigoritolerans]MCU6603808.1 lysozyme family protein [Peribacillus frigoritolerans]